MLPQDLWTEVCNPQEWSNSRKNTITRHTHVRGEVGLILLHDKNNRIYIIHSEESIAITNPPTPFVGVFLNLLLVLYGFPFTLGFQYKVGQTSLNLLGLTKQVKPKPTRNWRHLYYKTLSLTKTCSKKYKNLIVKNTLVMVCITSTPLDEFYTHIKMSHQS